MTRPHSVGLWDGAPGWLLRSLSSSTFRCNCTRFQSSLEGTEDLIFVRKILRQLDVRTEQGPNSLEAVHSLHWRSIGLLGN
jgi:hypothetical protein